MIKPQNLPQENRGEKNPPPKKKLDFNICKNNCLRSLQETEYFLSNLKNIGKFIKLYKILK